MTENEVQKTEQVVVVDDDSATKWVSLPHGCVVHGKHLVSDKLIGVIGEILKLDRGKESFGVRCIEFKDNGMPSGKVGMAYVDAGAVAINLEEIWSSCLSALEEGKVKLSMTGVIWDELLMTLLHEIHHVFTFQDAEYRALGKEDPEGVEKEAEAWAHERMIEFAQKFDIEPTPIANMTFFNVKLMELMTSDLKDEEWVVKARLQLEHEVMYDDDENDVMTKTFREYLRGISDPSEEDKDWEQGVSVIDLIFSLDDGSVVKTKEELPIPAVETVVVDSTGVATVTDTTVETASPAQALFAPAETTDAEGEEVVAADETVDMVPLPDHIAAEQAQVAAAAVAIPAEAPAATSYEPNGLSGETMVAFLKDVYMRLYTHTFTKCGRQLNSDQGFTNPGAVLEPVSIADLIQLHKAPGLVMEYDTLNASGQRQPEMCDKGFVRGTVFNKSNQHGIPAFCIYLNINGQRVKRSLIAQNPAKVNGAGQYSPMALEARAGHAIMWIMSEDENKKFVAKIRDNIYEAL
jgi:hypothetical protein